MLIRKWPLLVVVGVVGFVATPAMSVLVRGQVPSAQPVVSYLFPVL